MNSYNRFFEKGIGYLHKKAGVVIGAFWVVCSAPVEAEGVPVKRAAIGRVVEKDLASGRKKEVFKPVFEGALAV